MNNMKQPIPAPASGTASLPRMGAASTGRSRNQEFILQILSTARRRWKIIVGATIGCVLIGIIATLLATPKYTASSVVEIQRETGSVVDLKDSNQKGGGYADQEFYQTQYGLLQSRVLAERVASDLRLQDNAHFYEIFGGGREWFANGRPLNNVANRQVRLRAAGSILLANFQVNPQRLSRLVTLTFTSPDPGLSQQIVNKWATDFIQVTLERRYNATAYARQFLEQRIAQLRDRIDQSERRLVNYAGREGIVNLPGEASKDGTTAGERSLVADDLASLNKELTDAIADRIRAESRVNSPAGEVTEALNNPAITSLRQKRAELAADYAKMMVTFKNDYPPAVALSTQIQQLDRSIQREEQRVNSTIGQTYSASLARERDLRTRIASLKDDVLNYRRKSIQYNIYQRDVDTNRELYNGLLQRYKEIGVAGGVAVSNIAVVDTAEYPQNPSSPRLFVNVAIALLLGIILGLAGALLAEQLDQGLKDPSEVPDDLGIPLLGTTPKVSGDVFSQIIDRKSHISEAYLSLKTNLALTTAHGLPRTLAVTSTRPTEGKTTTSYALAQVIARASNRVVLIDADMRSPSIDHTFDLSNDVGLSTFLSGSDDLEALMHQPNQSGLTVITAGPRPPSAPELLASNRFPLLLERLCQMFDYVVIDAPPVMGLADAPIIGNRVEGLIFAVEANSTHKNMAIVALDRLRAADVSILGAVLTKYDPKQGHYGYGYNYGYGYGTHEEKH